MSFEAPKNDHAYHVAVLGGGTGPAAVTRALKHEAEIDLTGISAMSDNGGSTEWFRTSYDIGPVGDPRNLIGAFADDEQAVRLNDRLNGIHPLGNHLLADQISRHGLEKGIKKVVAELLGMTGSEVVPATLDKTHLYMKYGSALLIGENVIDTIWLPEEYPEPEVGLVPEVAINPTAQRVIEGSDLVVVAPGSLITSQQAVLLTKGMPEVLTRTQAPFVAFANLFTNPGHTKGRHVVDDIKTLERTAGRPFDYVLYNTHELPEEVKDRYAEQGKFLLSVTEKRFEEIAAEAIGDEIAFVELENGKPRIRNNGPKLAGHIIEICQKKDAGSPTRIAA
jgi:uncharacterized cofD-like protein